MATITTDDGVNLYVEETGSGTPIVFVHEFAGDLRSWEPQMRYFAHSYRCIAYNARGWPPSDVPDEPAKYSQQRACDDIRAVMDALEVKRAHIVGLSMGGFAALHFGLEYRDRALSLTVAGCGYGAEKDKNAQFRDEAETSAAKLRKEGMEVYADIYAHGPTRVQFENKDPRGFQEFKAMLKQHSAEGSAFSQLHVQRERPSLYDLEERLTKVTTPMLVVTGDEDWPCLLPNVYLKRTVPSAALFVMPNSGHTINLEEPALFNRALHDFITQVDAGRWPVRDPRAMTASITGVT